ncbi:MAG: 4Fe-4S dicluster domain-containing protein [Thermodesulfobacteriota bacterium]|nr:4Fe-4S dicluster domain-containing protein [Thermodesulfobacteriota bacterium]
MLEGRDELTIIQEDIKRALSRGNARWAMLIDLRRCILCHACTAGCIAEQKSPPGIIYRPVYEEEMGKFPNVKRRFTPRPCLQCDDPPCVEACPNKGEDKATWKSTKGVSAGIVMINYDQCIGCGRCVVACPYKARNMDGGEFYTEGTPKVEEYEKAPTWEYSKKWPRQKHHIPYGTARKCHFCVHRLKSKMVPMCVSTCIARANYFGDLEDKESLLYKMMQGNKVKVLQAIKAKGEPKDKVVKIKYEALRGKSPQDISKMIGYPGRIPVFADSSKTKPRVYYILP